MSKLKFDYTDLKTTILDLESIEKKLKNISNKIAYMDIPYFSKSNLLRTMKSEFNGSAQEIITLSNNIEKTNKIIEDFIDTYSIDAKKLPNYIIEKRDSIIKI